jgi:hypothetical protein
MFRRDASVFVSSRVLHDAPAVSSLAWLRPRRQRQCQQDEAAKLLAVFVVGTNETELTSRSGTRTGPNLPF